MLAANRHVASLMQTLNQKQVKYRCSSCSRILLIVQIPKQNRWGLSCMFDSKPRLPEFRHVNPVGWKQHTRQHCGRQVTLTLLDLWMLAAFVGTCCASQPRCSGQPCSYSCGLQFDSHSHSLSCGGANQYDAHGAVTNCIDTRLTLRPLAITLTCVCWFAQCLHRRVLKSMLASRRMDNW